MNDQPVTTLRKLIQRYGDDLASDARRTEALLNDYCPQYRREVFVLVHAQRQQVPEELLATPKWMPTDAAAAKLARRLQERLGFSEEAAGWAVRSWSIALGLQRNPSAAAKVLGWARNSLRNAHLPTQTTPAKGRKTQLDAQSSVIPASPDGSADLRTNLARLQGGTSIPATDCAHGPPAQDSKAVEDGLRSAGVEPAVPRHLRNLAGVAAAALSVALLWFLVMSTPAWDSVSPLLDRLRSPTSAAQDLYPLPRTAWVSDGPLLVRSGPSVADDSVSMLKAGEDVQVSEFSSDLNWSHIVQPVEGWVSNWYLNFPTAEVPGTTVRMLHQELAAARDGVTVFVFPNLQADTVASLHAGQRAVSIAATTDGRWRQITHPVLGWVAAEGLIVQE